MITLATFDPAVGADHIRTWASDAVAVVSAGRSSGTRIHSAGQAIRFAGVRLVSGVLLGADRDDESSGVAVA
jgi:hypothetical protein